jgi:hypothetical protein
MSVSFINSQVTTIVPLYIVQGVSFTLTILRGISSLFRFIIALAKSNPFLFTNLSVCSTNPTRSLLIRSINWPLAIISVFGGT